MRAYKFLMDNYKAMYGDFQYEIGETYIHNGYIELCKAGFHASGEIKDAIRYCSGSHLVEVELGGKIIEGLDKVVASEITILKELDLVKELETLASDEYWGVRCAVAYNPNTPVEILETLAGDRLWDVRRAVASNPNTSTKILETLAGDENSDVRRGVAYNLNTSVEILKTLAGDKNCWVRNAVAENLNRKKEDDSEN